MKAKIENIKKKFNVGESKENKDSPKVESEHYGYSEYTLRFYHDKQSIGIMTTSDFPHWKEDCISLIQDKVIDDSIVSVKLERSYPDCNKVGEIIYKGTFKKIKRGVKF